MPLVCKISVKPTPSIAKKQRTVDMAKMEDASIAVKGRHDPSIVPRVVPVAEAMVALVITDHMILSGRICPDRI
jgi:chorismate synthase